MSILEKLALPQINEKLKEELAYCKTSYETIENLNDARVNKDQRKKKILTVAFESLSGLFDLKYEQRLKFNKDDSDDSIYLENANENSFNENLYNMYCKCFNKYLEKLHTFKSNKVDDTTFTVAKLAYLNDDKEVLTKLINKSYLEIFNDTNLLIDNLVDEGITKEDLTRLVEKNKKRNNEIKSIVSNYTLFDELSPTALRNVYRCYSNDIFSSLNKDEKIHLCNLLYNYFIIGGKVDLYKKYGKLINKSTTNKKCLSLIINDLMIEGRTMMIIKRNKDLLKDILSGLQYVYENEVIKENVNKLDSLGLSLNSDNKR